jgi:hypothetical protein
MIWRTDDSWATAFGGSSGYLSDLGAAPPHPDPLHSPSKTGVNALMASGEREQQRRAEGESPIQNAPWSLIPFHRLI